MSKAFVGWEVGYEFYAGYLATPPGEDRREFATRYTAILREELTAEFPGAQIEIICKPGTTGLGGGPWVVEPDGMPADFERVGDGFQLALDRAEARLWIARHATSDGQAARWRESGFAPGARVEWICEGVRIAGTITDDGRVALDEPAHGESHLRLTSAWRVA